MSVLVPEKTEPSRKQRPVGTRRERRGAAAAVALTVVAVVERLHGRGDAAGAAAARAGHFGDTPRLPSRISLGPCQLTRSLKCMVTEAMTLILVMTNTVENLTKGKKGQLKMIYYLKSHFRKNNMEREEAKNRRFHLIAMDAYQRHTKFVNDYILYYGGKKEDFRRLGENDKTDMDVIRENHRFLWNEEDEMDMNWEKRLAKKYYDKLFKEYCIADLSRYKENKFGFRWRVEKEVISGKGQFCCGNKCCDEKEGLKSWEVNFGYTEHGEKRNALVKLRLCQECSFKLNFHHRRKEVKSKKRKDKAKKDSEESTHKKSRLSSVEETSKTKDKAHSSSVKSESSVNRNSDEEESASESELWKGPLPETDEKSQEEEFDEYFQDLFL
ncbi:hypothetical protein R6Z07F_017749 [Ovis aries]